MPDIPYNRPGRRRQYLSITKHFFNAVNSYSKWVNVNIDRNTFDYADYGGHTLSPHAVAWIDDAGNLWGFMPNFTVVGTQKEQFGFFPKTINETDEWHGYPVFPFITKRYNISESLIKRWISERYLDVDDIPSLVNKKKI
ncbi:MAG TPA: hypothetical protein VK590_03600 [Saprospiraceae bacterium]|nr:hypothetical protein [Saprospiraceae bacterium]